MAISFTPDDVASGFNLTKLNSNFDKTKTALSDALSRSGEGPNQMEADIDLNSNDLLNVGIANISELRIGGEVVTPDQLQTIPPSVMLKNVYDPNGVEDDAFDLANMSGEVVTNQIANNATTFDKIGTDLKTIANVLLTVGAGGQFSTINAALETASKLKIRPYVFGGFTVEVRLLTGFVMAEQVYIKGIDLSYVIITSVDSEVAITRSSLTIQIDGGSDSDFPVFSATNGGRLPIINVLFNMDASGSAAGRTFMYVRDVGSSGYVGQGKGCKNPGARGLEARYQAVIHAHQTIFTGAGNRALYALHQGRIFAEYANCDDCLGDIGVYALMGGEIMFTNGSVKNKVNTGPAIWANRGGKIIATQANADNCQSTNLSDGAVYASDGGEIVFDSGIATNSDGNGIAAVWGGKISARFANTSGAAQDGFYVVDGGTCDGTQAIASNCGRFGFYSSDLSNLNARGATATGCQKAAQADWGGRINARQATFTGGTSQGVAAQRGGYINIGLGNAQRGGGPAATDIVVATNGKIDAAGATGGLSQAANTITSAGLINQ